jgi:SagB-type dehydrogenase family enzyme
MSAPASTGETLYPAGDLVLRPSCSSTGAWLASWGEGSARETLEVTADLAAVLATLPAAVRAGELSAMLAPLLAGASPASLIGYLTDNGMLAREPARVPPGEQRLLAMNWADALVLHRATRGMLWRHEYPENAQIMTWTNEDVPVPVDEPRPSVSYDGLPDSVMLSEPLPGRLDTDVESVFARRRTKRNFTGTTVPEWALSTLLHVAFRPIIEGASRRYFTTLSSADGYREKAELHPVTAYVLFGRDGVIDGQADAVYRYNPRSHALQTVRAGTLSGYFRFSELLWGQDFADDAPAAVILSVNWQQFMWKYRSSHAYRFAHYDLGAYMQTAVLAATSLGMGSFITPALNDVKVSRLLGSSEQASAPTYFLAIGMGTSHDTDFQVPDE